MDKFIFDINKDKTNEFFLNIKKKIFEFSLSNNINFDEKIHIDTNNFDYSEIISYKDQFFDSFSENNN